MIANFQLALSEFTNNFHYDLDLLNELSFNPFSLNNMVTDSGDLDPSGSKRQAHNTF